MNCFLYYDIYSLKLHWNFVAKIQHYRCTWVFKGINHNKHIKWSGKIQSSLIAMNFCVFTALLEGL